MDPASLEIHLLCQLTLTDVIWNQIFPGVFTLVTGKKTVPCKLMRFDRSPSKIRSKSYLNWLLINFFDPNLGVRSIVATISIRIQTIYIKSSSILYQKSSILSKIGRIWSKTLLKLTIFNQIQPFSIKIEDFWLNNQYLINLNVTQFNSFVFTIFN